MKKNGTVSFDREMKNLNSEIESGSTIHFSINFVKKQVSVWINENEEARATLNFSKLCDFDHLCCFVKVKDAILELKLSDGIIDKEHANVTFQKFSQYHRSLL